MSTEQERVGHTPGPWRVSRVQSWGVETPTGDIVRCYGPNADANARLVAAAPELLEALQGVMTRAESEFHDLTDGEHGTLADYSEFIAASEAIRKATNP